MESNTNSKSEFNTELKTVRCTGWSNWANWKQHPERKRRGLRSPHSCERQKHDPACSRVASRLVVIVAKNSAQEKRASYLLTTATNERPTHPRKRSWLHRMELIMLKRRNVNVEKARLRKSDSSDRRNENPPNPKHQQRQPRWKRSFWRHQRRPRRWWWIKFVNCKN